MEGSTVPPLHGLAWLVQDDGSLGLSGEPAPGCVSSAADLPEGGWELHWFENAAAAAAFCRGVAAAGSNAATAVQGEGSAARGALLRRADRETDPSLPLEEAVPLACAPGEAIARRVAETRWKDDVDAIDAAGPSPSATVRPIHVVSATPDELVVRCRFPEWNLVMKGGTGGRVFRVPEAWLAVRMEGGRKVAETRQNPFPAATSDERFSKPVGEIVKEAGGSWNGSAFVFPFDDGILDLAWRIAPLFERIVPIEDEAGRTLRLESLREDEENVRIARAVRNGGTLARTPNGFMLTAAGRTAKRVSGPRVHRMAEAGLLREDGNGNYEACPEGEWFEPEPSPGAGAFRM